VRWLAFAALVVGCGNAHEKVTCDDVGPADFKAVAQLVTSATAKGCARCHNTRTPVYGYNFEGPAVSWDALVNRMDSVYAQLASGEMPKDGERWSEADLRVLRSWYCHGGFYEE
jgi:hypothetical protein